MTALTTRPEIVWSDTCHCTSEAYSALVHFALGPVHRLLRESGHRELQPMAYLGCPFLHPRRQTASSTLSLGYVASSLGLLTRALTSLMCRHGEDGFQTSTDRLPGFFHLVAELVKWARWQRSESCPFYPLTSTDSVPREQNLSGPIMDRSVFCPISLDLIDDLVDFDLAQSDLYGMKEI
ncbi:unnamed protein product [Protopolystoma xenopodis]|uniref:Uncharacterized protein n=1 Tax=Protopolystoma xenopodis TaxID=117903 RepID=A0A448XBM0_9PLAT|nr:unnamed protein product [Protopolystoma xenopodis]